MQPIRFLPGGRVVNIQVLFLTSAINSLNIADFQIGTRIASRADLGKVEGDTERLKIFGLKIPDFDLVVMEWVA